MTGYDDGAQDWCLVCDEPRTIVDVSDETDVRTIAGTGIDYRAVHLSCGHSTIAQEG